ncbi:MAG TPA: type 1 glutamine amidotransferase [Bellilinea sp.]|nr:type 1 glutamine amidotransferase [Bellilinea sp.]
MPAPIIGITSGRTPDKNQTVTISLSEKYTEAIQRAGGIPLVVPSTLDDSSLRELFERLDGFLLTGGGDIDPVIFNGTPHPNVYGIDHARDYLEIELVRFAAHNQVPFLGICRGVQVMNVALGGTLFTDIGAQLPDAERHDWYPNIPRDKIAHKVSINSDSRLSILAGGAKLAVNSLHHQGLDAIPPMLEPVAHSADGLVEAVELRDHRFGLGVQWHPEWLVESAGNQAIFEGLIRAAAAR